MIAWYLNCHFSFYRRAISCRKMCQVLLLASNYSNPRKSQSRVNICVLLDIRMLLIVWRVLQIRFFFDLRYSRSTVGNFWHLQNKKIIFSGCVVTFENCLLKIIRVSFKYHSFIKDDSSICAKFFGRITFLTPWYAHLRLRLRG